MAKQMYTIEYVRERGVVFLGVVAIPKIETRFMKMTVSAFDALMKYSVGPGGGKIFGNAWLIGYHCEGFR
jgi:hypothetical protein